MRCVVLATLHQCLTALYSQQQPSGLNAFQNHVIVILVSQIGGISTFVKNGYASTNKVQKV